MSVMFHNFWQEEWLLRERVEFDGIQRLIYIHPDISEVSVKAHLYSAWKRWITLRKNAAFAPAMRVVGGDPIGGGQFAGDIYFMINGWRIVIDHFVVVNGAIYDDESTFVRAVIKGGNEYGPFIITATGGVYSTVSALVQSVETLVPVVTGDVSAIPAALTSIGQKTDNVVAAVTAQSTAVNNIDTRTTEMATDINIIDARTATTLTAVNSIDTRTTEIATDVNNIDTRTADIMTEVNGIDVRTTEIATEIGTIDTRTTEMATDINNIDTRTTEMATDVNSIDTWTGEMDTWTLEQSARTTGIEQDLTTMQASMVETNQTLTEMSQTGSLTTAQQTMLLEMYELLGLDPSKPLVVSTSQRTAGGINQTISTHPTTKTTTVTRI